MTKEYIDPIDSIFENIETGSKNNGIELFRDDSKDIDLKTDLTHTEHVIVSCIATDNEFIKRDLGFDLYGEFLNQFRRHKVSLDRKSRSEFVQVNMKNTIDRDLDRISNLKNLSDSRN